jgi:hypothetical protein
LAQVNQFRLYGSLGIILKDADMTVVIGPVLKRADGYEFDTWTAGKEVARGYRYRRIEDAYYARNADIKASAQGRAPAAIVCQTLDEFIVKLTEDRYPIDGVYLAAKTPWLQRQLRNPLGLGDRRFVVGRRPVAGEELPPRQPDLMLDDTGPFRLSRNHFMIEQRHEAYHVRDLRSTLGTIVNGQPIGDHFCTYDVLLRAGENEVIAGGAGSPFVFSVSIPGPLVSASRWTGKASWYSERRPLIPI